MFQKIVHNKYKKVIFKTECNFDPVNMTLLDKKKTFRNVKSNTISKPCERIYNSHICINSRIE